MGLMGHGTLNDVFPLESGNEFRNVDPKNRIDGQTTAFAEMVSRKGKAVFRNRFRDVC